MPQSVADITVRLKDDNTDAWEKLPRDVLWTHEFPYGGSLSIVRYHSSRNLITMLRIIDRIGFTGKKKPALYVSIEKGWVEGFIKAALAVLADAPDYAQFQEHGYVPVTTGELKAKAD
jgi:hypothetical protein